AKGDNVDCSFRFDIADGKPAVLVSLSDTVVDTLLTFAADSFVQVQCLFPSNGFPAVRDVLIERYGPPTSDTKHDLNWAGKRVSLQLVDALGDDRTFLDELATIRQRRIVDAAFENAKIQQETAFRIAMLNPTPVAQAEMTRKQEQASQEVERK